MACLVRIWGDLEQVGGGALFFFGGMGSGIRLRLIFGLAAARATCREAGLPLNPGLGSSTSHPRQADASSMKSANPALSGGSGGLPPASKRWNTP